MLSNKLTNMIVSHSHGNGSSLHDGVQEVLDGINNCLTITNRVAAKKNSNTAFEKGSYRAGQGSSSGY